jgi:hypothetical protein
MLSFYIPLDPLSRLGLTSSQCPTIQQRHTFRPGIPSRHKIETSLSLRHNHLLHHHNLRHKRRIPQPARESLSLIGVIHPAYYPHRTQSVTHPSYLSLSSNFILYYLAIRKASRPEGKGGPVRTGGWIETHIDLDIEACSVS